MDAEGSSSTKTTERRQSEERPPADMLPPWIIVLCFCLYNPKPQKSKNMEVRTYEKNIERNNPQNKNRSRHGSPRSDQ